MQRKSVRLEVRLTPDLYEDLLRTAQFQRRSMGETVREAVGEYISKHKSVDKHALLRQMTELQAPVANWETIKNEIQTARTSKVDRDSRLTDHPKVGKFPEGSESN